MQEHNREIDGVSQSEVEIRHTQDARFQQPPLASPANDSGAKRRPFFKGWVVIAAVVFVAMVAIAGAIYYWMYSRQYEWTDDAFIDGRITQISPKVAGYVVALHVDDNRRVHAGEPLLEIDPADYQAAGEEAQSGLEAAHSRVRDAESQVALAQASERSAAAEIASAQATSTNAARVLERAQTASSSVPSAVSGQELDQARADARSAAANLTSAQAKLAEAQAQVAARQAELATARANVRQAEAQVRTAQLNLGHTEIAAPVAGRITHRSVEVGDYLQPGQPLLAIVQDDFWVTANFKETQLDEMQVGQPVAITIDAFPERDLPGHIDSFQRGTGAQFSLLPPENATGNYVKVVQRVPVKIVFDHSPPADLPLGPGMSVVPTVKVR